MQILVPYGKTGVPVEIPEDRFAGAVGPNNVLIGDETEELNRALSHPHGPKTFDQFVSDAEDLVVIVNDRTRPTPTADVLTHVSPKLAKAKRLTFVIATGVHRAPTPEEYLEIFGGLCETYRDRIIAHDARKSEDMVYLGRSKNGTEMHLNRHVTAASKILVIGSVEPHYFAGYTGGRKSFLPGVASYATIEQNHKHALLPSAGPLALEGNPVHEDMVDAIECIRDRDIFAIMTVLDRDHRLYAVTAGDIDRSFYAAVDRANDVFSVPIKEKADVVVAVAPPPMDVDLYQSHKALENGKLALRDGGIIILVAECRGGVGEEAFVKLLRSAPTPAEVLAAIRGGYRLGYHKAAKIVETATWAEIWAVTSLDAELLRGVPIRSAPSLQRAVDEALDRKGPEARVLFLTAASLTVPRVAPD